MTGSRTFLTFVHLMETDANGPKRPFVQTPANVRSAPFAPNAGWVVSADAKLTRVAEMNLTRL
jgi:hypothetical protein